MKEGGKTEISEKVVTGGGGGGLTNPFCPGSRCREPHLSLVGCISPEGRGWWCSVVHVTGSPESGSVSRRRLKEDRFRWRSVLKDENRKTTEEFTRLNLKRGSNPISLYGHSTPAPNPVHRPERLVVGIRRGASGWVSPRVRVGLSSVSVET